MPFTSMSPSARIIIYFVPSIILVSTISESSGLTLTITSGVRTSNFFMLMIFAGVCLSLDNAHTALTPFALFSLYTSAFFGGFVAVKKNKGRDALLCSSLCGVFTTIMFCLVFWIVGLIFDIKSDMLSWVFRALCIISSIIGGFIGRGSPKKPKRKRRR